MMVATENQETRRRALRFGLGKAGTFVALVGALVLVVGCPPPAATPPPSCDDNGDCTTAALPFCLVAADATTGVCVVCLTDDNCDDGTFCNGDETCTDANICIPGPDPCTAANEECNEVTDNCDTTCDDDADCAAPTPFCETTDGVCVECMDAADCDDTDLCTSDACTDNACVNDDSSDCTADEVCNPADGECVECLEDADCAEGEDCASDNTCRAAVVGFNVTIDDCPDNAVVGTSFNLSASVTGETSGGRVVYTWTASNATITGDDDANPEDVTVTPTGAAPLITVNVVDNTVSPAVDPVPVTGDACTDDDDCDAVAGETCGADSLCSVACTDDADCAAGEVCFTSLCSAAGTPETLNEVDTDSDTCSPDVSVLAEITVNAGADRVLAFPVGAFGPGNAITLGTTVLANMAASPGLFAVANDPEFEDREIAFDWSTTGAPTGAMTSDALILNSSAVLTNVVISSVGTFSGLTLTTAGQTGTRVGSPVPGPYSWSVTINNPAGLAASDDVTYVLVPQFQIPVAAGGSLQGISIPANANSHFVVARNATFMAPFSVLARQSGTLSFTAVDQSGGGNALATVPLNSDPLTPSDPAALGSSQATGALPDPGTWQLQGAFGAGEASVGAGNTGMFLHVQRSLDASVAVGELGIVESDTGSFTTPNLEFHGFQTGSALFGDPSKVMEADIYGNGDPHVISAAMGGTTIQTLRQISNATANGSDANTVLEAPAAIDTITTAANIVDFCAADIDGDGDVDIAVAMEDRIAIYWNNGDTDVNDMLFTIKADGTTFDGPSTITHDGQVGLVTNIVCLNYNGDAAWEVAWGDPTFESAGTDDADNAGLVRMLRGAAPGSSGMPNPGATLAFSVVPNSAFWLAVGTDEDDNTADDDRLGSAMAYGNFSSSSMHDLIVGAPGAVGAGAADSARGSVFRYEANQTTGTLQAGTLNWSGIVDADTFGTSLCVGDTDGDGDNEILVGAPGFDGAGGAEGAVYVVLNGAADTIDGDTPRFLGTAANDGIGDSRTLLACGDIDGDGRADVLVGGQTNERILLWFGDATLSTGAFTHDTEFTGFTLDATTDLGFLDLNNDGVLDLYIQDDSATTAVSGYYGVVPVAAP